MCLKLKELWLILFRVLIRPTKIKILFFLIGYHKNNDLLPNNCFLYIIFANYIILINLLKT